MMIKSGISFFAIAMFLVQLLLGLAISHSGRFSAERIMHEDLTTTLMYCTMMIVLAIDNNKMETE